jgi:hypothetical protein
MLVRVMLVTIEKEIYDKLKEEAKKKGGKRRSRD